MNSRQRSLLISVLVGLIVIGVLGYYSVYTESTAALKSEKDALQTTEGKLAAEENAELQTKEGELAAKEKAELQTKENELAKEKAERKRMFDRNPRLQLWSKISLSCVEENPRDAMGKREPDTVGKNVLKVQADYELYLMDLLRRHNFVAVTITPKMHTVVTADPQQQNKVPVYTKLAFGVQGQANWATLEQMLNEFYRDPLLHQVRMIEIKVPLARGGGRGGAVAAAPGARQADALDVVMTVEALIVNGAEQRPQLMPAGVLPQPSLKPGQEIPAGSLVVLSPHRSYPDMATYNPFYPPPDANGAAAQPRRPGEAEAEAEFIKLTRTQRGENGPWEAVLYDQAAGPPERRVDVKANSEYVVYGRDPMKALLKLRVVHLDESKLVFEELVQGDEQKANAKYQYYQLQVGDFLGWAIHHPLTAEQLKALGVKAKPLAAVGPAKPAVPAAPAKADAGKDTTAERRKPEQPPQGPAKPGAPELPAKADAGQKAIAERLKAVEAELATIQADNKRLKTVDDWEVPPVLDELYDLCGRLKNTRQMRLSQVKVEPLRTLIGKSPGYAVKYTITGVKTGASNQPLVDLSDTFKSDRYYATESVRETVDQFILTVNVERRAPGEYKTDLKVPK